VTNDPVITMQGIHKSFGAVEVLHGVDFAVRPGEVHVLAGENGAGKSTLIRILSGVYDDWSGSVTMQGRTLDLAHPRDAVRAGIATIHQELSLIPTMSVADNLFLGRELGRFGAVRFAREEAEAARLLREMDLEFSPRQSVAELPLSSRQLLEIGRALGRDALLFIFDEPTSALGEHEVEPLFARIQALTRRGRGVVYITHRMEEIYRLADRITVLRDGRVVGTATPQELPPGELVRWMVGRDLARGRASGAAAPDGRRTGRDTSDAPLAGSRPDASAAAPDGRRTGRDTSDAPRAGSRPDASAAAPDGRRTGRDTSDAPLAGSRPDAGAATGREPAAEPALAVEALRVAHPERADRPVVEDVSFTVGRGEIVGLAGLQGSGASEVLHALFGALGRRASGRASLGGAPLAMRSPRESVARGLMLLTSDRKGTGLAPDLSVAHNVSLASLPRLSTRLGWVRRQREQEVVAGLARDFRLDAPSLAAPVRTLSGGNQQKAYLARCLLPGPRVLLLDEPTRGIDVGAKADIYALMREWVAAGIAILLITSEMEELLALSDRVLVMHRGRVAAELAGADATKEKVLAAAMGGGTAA
jgi:ABC-type sugar transport system ATPase subunit